MVFDSLEQETIQILLRSNSMWAPFCGCWLWELGLNNDGYGYIDFKGSRYRVHRFSYLIFRGPIPESMCVCHTCDTELCINPGHLFLGTHTDNMADKVVKGRQSKGEKHGMSLGGEKNGRAKLQNSQISEILAKSGLSHRKIAKEYGVCRSTISSIIRRATWKHTQ